MRVDLNLDEKIHNLPIAVNPDIVDLFTPTLGYAETPAYPLPTQIHLASLHALNSEFADAGDFADSTHHLLDEFTDKHDIGYAVDIERLLANKSSHEIMQRLINSLGSTATSAMVNDYLSANTTNYLASRVIGHGLMGLVANTQAYANSGIDPDKAYGLSVLFGAHHPGFPIDMVSGFLQGTSAEVPDILRAPLLIDVLGEQPEGLRKQLSNIGAEALGIDEEDAARIVSLGYGIDRLTAGRVPDSITIQIDGRVGANSNMQFTTIRGGEVIQKKYGLVADDLRRANSNPTIENLYLTCIERLAHEATSAVNAAHYLGQPNVASVLTKKASHIIGQTETQQNNALQALREIEFSPTHAQADGAESTSLAIDELKKARRNLLAYIANHQQTIPEGSAYLLATLDTLITR